MSDRSADCPYLTWEMLWLNTVVLAWGSDGFRSILAGDQPSVRSPRFARDRTTRMCLYSVLEGIWPGHDAAHSLAAFKERLNEAGESRDKVLAVIQEQAAHLPRRAAQLLPAWLELAVVMPSSADSFMEGGGWELPRTEVTVRLPSLADSRDDGQARAERLVLLMTTARGEWPFGSVGSEAADRGTLSGTGVADSPGESPLPAFEQSYRWFYVWSKVIASAGDPDFRKRLEEDPALVLSSRYGYEVPNGTRLTFVEQRREDQEDDRGPVFLSITLVLPPPPPLEDRAIALADYAEMGRTYPFTLCIC